MAERHAKVEMPSSLAGHEQFIADLAEIQEFLSYLTELMAESSAEADSEDYFMKQFADEYLQALKLKERQLAGVRMYLRRLEQQNEEGQPEYQLLRDILNDVEPKCRQVVSVLTRLRSGQSVMSESCHQEQVREVTSPPVLLPAECTTSDTFVKMPSPLMSTLSDSTMNRHFEGLTVQSPAVVVVDNVIASSSTNLPTEQHQAQLAQTRSSGEQASGDQKASSGRSSSNRERQLQQQQATPRPSVEQQAAGDVRLSDRKARTERKLGEAVTGLTIEDWIEKVKETKSEGVTKWRVNRKQPDYLQSLCEKYENARDRELRRDLMVIFDGEEEAVDRFALTREYFFISFETAISGQFKDCKLLIGERGHLLPDARTDHLVHAYKFLGIMMAHAIKSGCHGLPGLSPAIIHYLVHGSGLAFIEDLQPPVTIEDVDDQELHHILTKLDSEEKLMDTEQETLRGWMERSNCRMALNPGTRMLVIQTLIIYYVFKMRVRQIDALAEGMEVFDLRRFLRNNPSKENLAIVFPSPDDIKITPQMFMATMITRGNEYDQQTFDFLENFLKDLDGGNIANWNISDLVRFTTGSPYLPHQIVISFNMKSAGLPVAHACFNELELPSMHVDYASFCHAMTRALESPLEFHMS